MSSTEKFTVCIATYNQMDYIETMLQSVFEQDYKDLEVIIVDDCSPDFDQAKLEKIIQKHNRRNIPYEIIHNKKNVGIVKGLNSAISIAKGAYIYFVAGDDKLQDSAVVSHFVRAFHAQPKSNIITSEYLLYDTALSQIVDASSDPMGGGINMMSSREQYLYLCDGCKFASGATAYRTKTLKKYHGFDEDYKHVEDWPTWLRMLINGEKIYYAGFISLCHRDGGISHDKSKKVPKHVQEYYNDMIKVYKKEILGNLGKLKPREKAQALSAVTKKFLKGKVKPTDSHQLEDYRKKHTFVICAYKEIPYLEDCVKSLLSQTLKSEIIISTSTPNKFIKDIAKKYKIKLAINKGAAGHINDFCFAYKQAKTKYVTLCHQDDFYNPDFAEKIVKKMEKAKNPLIGFSDYYEIRDGKITKHNSVLAVKRILNFPLIFLGCFKFVRLANLSLGNAICAPAVTYNKELLEYPIKKSNFTSNIDWDSYDDFARRKGSFVYVAKPLLGHRIHTGSTTTKVIGNGAKQKEDYEMFLRYWPKPIAKLIVKLYGNSEKSNTLKERKKK